MSVTTSGKVGLLPSARVNANPAVRWRMLLGAALCAGTLAGALAATGTSPPPGRDANELAVLLRFMASIKACLALGLAWASWWRLGLPVSARIGAAYIISGCLMPAGAGLIWGLAHVGLGAACFHTGLLLFITTAWLDRDRPPLLPARH